MSDGLQGAAQSGSPSRTALLVVGMHRSGTSALARVLSLLGAALPEHVMGAMPTNESGHWEPERLINLHDEMLGEAGSRWDDWRRFEPAVLGPERLSHYKSEIARLISEEYGDAPLFVLKDPRLCRFVPFYEEILGEMGVTPLFVLTHRDPASVLDSLAARDDMDASRALLVWLRHVLDAEEATRDKTRSFASYEEYLNDWRATVARVSSELGVEWPRRGDEAGREIDAFLLRGLQHHAATPDDPATGQHIGPAVHDAYGALSALTADGGDSAALQTLSRVREEFESGQPAALGIDLNDWRDLAARVFEEMAVRQNNYRVDREQLRELVSRQQDEMRAIAEAKSALEKDLAALRSSTSWRLTMPVRAVKRLATDPRGTIAALRARNFGARR